jgi:hypothetical protein
VGLPRYWGEVFQTQPTKNDAHRTKQDMLSTLASESTVFLVLSKGPYARNEFRAVRGQVRVFCEQRIQAALSISDLDVLFPRFRTTTKNFVHFVAHVLLALIESVVLLVYLSDEISNSVPTLWHDEYIVDKAIGQTRTSHSFHIPSCTQALWPLITIVQLFLCARVRMSAANQTAWRAERTISQALDCSRHFL